MQLISNWTQTDASHSQSITNAWATEKNHIYNAKYRLLDSFV